MCSAIDGQVFMLNKLNATSAGLLSENASPIPVTKSSINWQAVPLLNS